MISGLSFVNADKAAHTFSCLLCFGCSFPFPVSWENLQTALHILGLRLQNVKSWQDDTAKITAGARTCRIYGNSACGLQSQEDLHVPVQSAVVNIPHFGHENCFSWDVINNHRNCCLWNKISFPPPCDLRFDLWYFSDGWRDLDFLLINRTRDVWRVYPCTGCVLWKTDVGPCSWLFIQSCDIKNTHLWAVLIDA